MPSIKEIFTTSNEVKVAMEIENKEGVPYKIKLPQGTEVIIKKPVVKLKQNMKYFIESKLV